MTLPLSRLCLSLGYLSLSHTHSLSCLSLSRSLSTCVRVRRASPELFAGTGRRLAPRIQQHAQSPCARMRRRVVRAQYSAIHTRPLLRQQRAGGRGRRSGAGAHGLTALQRALDDAFAPVVLCHFDQAVHAHSPPCTHSARPAHRSTITDSGDPTYRRAVLHRHAHSAESTSACVRACIQPTECHNLALACPGWAA